MKRKMSEFEKKRELEEKILETSRERQRRVKPRIEESESNAKQEISKEELEKITETIKEEAENTMYFLEKEINRSAIISFGLMIREINRIKVSDEQEIKNKIIAPFKFLIEKKDHSLFFKFFKIISIYTVAADSIMKKYLNSFVKSYISKEVKYNKEERIKFFADFINIDNDNIKDYLFEWMSEAKECNFKVYKILKEDLNEAIDRFTSKQSIDDIGQDASNKENREQQDDNLHGEKDKRKITWQQRIARREEVEEKRGKVISTSSNILNL
ncbi:hypothetical protein NF27_HQ00530 [Candidatus Jidaibacter acanthamoeba]|uniref:Uncharacterized protein n=1 Tax=Candidatus Jidaibacter acanthamoebae TaxID=86105 RepID=A0A0C1QWZ4_9RICK|nr:hypothetical protein [Candidatus Jidaibacter acanthamoeba]KIE04515.1 hypothetical protein NF27_HQ00530 [Candidatus Jidaibacter acanthamoeba]